ncbi:hypothetical protein BJQ97_02139 [Geobacillus sp. TFV-3]|nr:hypothetical protein BJQ97_02139 [Geobacillus sp. TFV-3]
MVHGKEDNRVNWIEQVMSFRLGVSLPIDLF